MTPCSITAVVEMSAVQMTPTLVGISTTLVYSSDRGVYGVSRVCVNSVHDVFGCV